MCRYAYQIELQDSGRTRAEPTGTTAPHHGRGAATQRRTVLVEPLASSKPVIVNEPGALRRVPAPAPQRTRIVVRVLQPVSIQRKCAQNSDFSRVFRA